MIDLNKKYKTYMNTEVRGLWQDGSNTWGYLKNEYNDWEACRWDNETHEANDLSYPAPGYKLVEEKKIRTEHLNVEFVNNGSVTVNGILVSVGQGQDLGIFASKRIELILEEGENETE